MSMTMRLTSFTTSIESHFVSFSVEGDMQNIGVLQEKVADLEKLVTDQRVQLDDVLKRFEKTGHGKYYYLNI